MVFPNLPGHTLQESLDELMQLQMLSPALALRYFKPCQQKTHTMQGLQYIPPSLPCSVPFSHSVIFNNYTSLGKWIAMSQSADSVWQVDQQRSCYQGED